MPLVYTFPYGKDKPVAKPNSNSSGVKTLKKGYMGLEKFSLTAKICIVNPFLFCGALVQNLD